MKKRNVIFLTLVLVLALLTACTGNGSSGSNTENSSGQNQQESSGSQGGQQGSQGGAASEGGAQSGQSSSSESGSSQGGSSSESGGAASQGEDGQSGGSQENQSGSTEETVGAAMLTEFRTQMEIQGSEDLNALVSAILENPMIQFSSTQTPVEPGYLVGFPNQEISDFSEGVMFGPVANSLPFVGYVFRLDDNADVASFCDQLKEAADLNWNLNSEAEELVLDQIDNTVFFLMAPASLEEQS